ncbi:hypothetical protein [Massilia sp. DD77]|uniref:hypothetical protein n=1 Tax=Massilia sp. DD77 TaxID=3109349 RepID=UPI002FFF870E
MTKSFMNDPVAPRAEKPQQQFTFEPLSGGQEKGVSIDGDGTQTSPACTASRLFFPTNREDILLQLSSLAISRGLPAGQTVVPVQDDALALLPDGLRTDEISLLQGGQAGRFPVLVELRESVGGERFSFGMSEVAALWFRSQEDADDFRFRPVDELNTEELTCRVDPQLFDLPGSPRFRQGSEESLELRDRGRFSDRIAGGVCSVLELGATQPVCWHDIAELLCRPLAATPSHEVTLAGALASGCMPASEGGQANIVLRAFIAHGTDDSASTLVARIHANLTDGTDDESQIRKVERWFSMANAVLQNRARLDGELLSDEGSVALRASLLASVVGDVRALIPFLHAPRPAGRKVIVAAAFLIGLRTGVIDMPWTMKRTRLSILSPLIVALRVAALETRESVGGGFQVEPDETLAGVVLRLFWRDHEVACWPPSGGEVSVRQEDPEREADPATELQPALRPDEAGSAVASVSSDSVLPESGAPDCIRSLDGRSIDLLWPAPPRKRGVTLRCVLSEGDRLRKPKEILEIAGTGGLLWRAGISAEGTEALYADLLEWPGDSLLEELSGTLALALDAYLVKKKARAASASTRRGKAAPKKSEAEPGMAPGAEQREAD